MARTSKKWAHPHRLISSCLLVLWCLCLVSCRDLCKHELQDQPLRTCLQKAQSQSALQSLYQSVLASGQPQAARTDLWRLPWADRPWAPVRLDLSCSLTGNPLGLHLFHAHPTHRFSLRGVFSLTVRDAPITLSPTKYKYLHWQYLHSPMEYLIIPLQFKEPVTPVFQREFKWIKKKY